MSTPTADPTRDNPGPTTKSVLERLNDVLDIGAPSIRSTASIVGSDPLVPSPHRLADVTSAAMAAFGLQMAGIAEDAGSDPQTVTVRATDAIDQLRATYISSVSGVSPVHMTEDPRALGNNDFYRCRGGRWIFLITTYPALRDAVCRVLNCPPFPERIAEAAAHWDVFALEDAVCAAGGVCAAVRSTDEWRASDPGQYLADRDVVDIAPIGSSATEPLVSDKPGSILDGVRVVDLTHVIAGPVATRLLAAFGADVLHVSRPDNPDPIAMISLTGGGKRNAYADLRDPGQDQEFRAVCAETDVFVTSYRGMGRRGYAAQTLATARPGIIVCEYHCWGADGPWAARGGFDQLACSATGFALSETRDGRPSLPPTYLLNDYLAAYLGAAGIAAALRKRATDGGSWRVRIDLARVCMWVQDQGLFDSADVAHLPRPDAPTVDLVSVDSAFGEIVEPALPLAFSGGPTPRWGAPTPLGSSPLSW